MGGKQTLAEAIKKFGSRTALAPEACLPGTISLLRTSIAAGEENVMASSNEGGHGHPQSTAKIAGHPLHPMLVQFPIVCFVLTLIFDILYTRGQTDVAQWTIWLLGIGLGMGALAAVTGLTDFLGEKRIQGSDAIKHALANVTAVVLEVVNLILRLKSTDSIGSTGVYISLVVAVILLYSGWKGADLVYRHGMGVDDTAR
jgi:uncharacterized membrane protein